MDRKLTKKSSARAIAAPAPVKKSLKQSLADSAAARTSSSSTPKPTSSASSTVPPTNTLKRKQNPIAEHDLDFLSLLEPSFTTISIENDSTATHSSSAGTSKKPKSTKKSDSTTTTQSTVTKKTLVKRPRVAAEVVVFDAKNVGGSKKDSGGSASGGGLDFNFKSFMSSKISKLDEVAPVNTENPMTAKEVEEERENKRHDAELHSLIKDSRILDSYNAQHLDGVERRRHQTKQLMDLGIQKKSSVKTPFQISLGMMAKQRERDIKELEEAKNNGTYHKSIKHTFAAAGGKKKETKRSDRGLKSSMGRFKNGMLTLTEKEIKSVQREGTKKKSSGGGKKGAGGGSKGKSGGGKKKMGKGRK